MAKKNVTSKLNLIPTAGYLLIEPESVETKTAGGIYIPETANTEKPQMGKVLAVGADEVLENGRTKSAPAKVNEKVIYKKWGGTEVKHEGKDLLFSKFEDILAVVK